MSKDEERVQTILKTLSGLTTMEAIGCLETIKLIYFTDSLRDFEKYQKGKECSEKENQPKKDSQ